MCPFLLIISHHRLLPAVSPFLPRIVTLKLLQTDCLLVCHIFFSKCYTSSDCHLVCPPFLCKMLHIFRLPPGMPPFPFKVLHIFRLPPGMPPSFVECYTSSDCHLVCPFFLLKSLYRPRCTIIFSQCYTSSDGHLVCPFSFLECYISTDCHLA